MSKDNQRDWRSVSISEEYEAAVRAAGDAPVGHPPGFYVDDFGNLKPIKGAMRYDEKPKPAPETVPSPKDGPDAK
jgi:hypothetical protein